MNSNSQTHPNLFSQIDWNAIAQLNRFKLAKLTETCVTFNTERYGELFLAPCRDGQLGLRTTMLPSEHPQPDSFEALGTGYNQRQKLGYGCRQRLPYLANGALIASNVLSDRLLCLLRGESLDSIA